MTKLFAISLLFLTYTFSFSQEVKELKVKYYIEINLEGKGLIEIYEYNNIETFERKLFKPKQGTYFLRNDNHNQKFWFTINKNRKFDGIGKAEIWNKEYTFHFQDGIAIKTEVRNNNAILVRSYEISDTIFITKHFSDKGNLYNTTIWNNRRQIPIKSIHYYENRNVSQEYNNVEKTRKTFYENGMLKTYQNEKSKEQIEYDEQGRKLTSYEKSPSESCTEWLENELLSRQHCYNSNLKRVTDQYYKNGKLNYYIIIENGEIKKYNEKNKLISTEKENNMRTTFGVPDVK